MLAISEKDPIIFLEFGTENATFLYEKCLEFQSFCQTLLHARFQTDCKIELAMVLCESRFFKRKKKYQIVCSNVILGMVLLSRWTFSEIDEKTTNLQ